LSRCLLDGLLVLLHHVFLVGVVFFPLHDVFIASLRWAVNSYLLGKILLLLVLHTEHKLPHPVLCQCS
jgi:hypothetical protein